MFFHKAQEKHQNEIRQKIKQFLRSYKFFSVFFCFIGTHKQREKEKLERFFFLSLHEKVLKFCCDEFLIIL